jgi:hypothetical protein
MTLMESSKVNKSGGPAQCAGPLLDVKTPRLKLPPKAADCHCHVFGPLDQYPWVENRLYTPPPVTLDDYLAMLRATGFERGVMVQTGLYGTDNRFIVDAIKAHPGRLRGIALIGEDITDRELRHLADNGVRGFRVNRTARTGLAFDVARRLAERTKELGWHVQLASRRLPTRWSRRHPIAWCGARIGRTSCWKRRCRTMAIWWTRSPSGCRTKRCVSGS